MIERIYAEYAWEKTETLLAIDSPSGYTAKAASWVKEAFEKLGFAAKITTKGGVPWAAWWRPLRETAVCGCRLWAA